VPANPLVLSAMQPWEETTPSVFSFPASTIDMLQCKVFYEDGSAIIPTFTENTPGNSFSQINSTTIFPPTGSNTTETIYQPSISTTIAVDSTNNTKKSSDLAMGQTSPRETIESRAVGSRTDVQADSEIMMEQTDPLHIIVKAHSVSSGGTLKPNTEGTPTDTDSTVSTEKQRSPMVIKFDSGCSRCVTGNIGRLREVFPVNSPHYNTQISGFNGTTSKIEAAGLNEDNKVEYYIPDMSPELCLLCARDYASEGAAFLFAQDGVVVRLNEEQMETIRSIVAEFTPLMKLKVVNNTYEVVNNIPDDNNSLAERQLTSEDLYTDRSISHEQDEVYYSSLDHDTTGSNLSSTIIPTIPKGMISGPLEAATNSGVLRDSSAASASMKSFISTDLQQQRAPRTELSSVAPTVPAFGVTAAKFFNTRVNVSSVEERILAYLMAGLTLRTLRDSVTNKLLDGIHPSITVASIDKFVKTYGATPDVFALAYPFPYGGGKGYLSQPKQLTRIGEWVQADFMEPDYTEYDVISGPDAQTPANVKKARRTKIKALGGASYGFVAVDAYSGYLLGILVPSTANSLSLIQTLVAHYAAYNHKIELLSSDVGVMPRKMFRVLSTETQDYLNNLGIKTRQAEPHFHQNGTPHVERTILAIKQSMTKAIRYLIDNPNFHHTGFNPQQAYSLWGELFMWSILSWNMSTSTRDPQRTRSEMFTGIKPHLQDCRMLPICAMLLVWRHSATADATPDDTNRDHWQRGIYVGPDLDVKGAIRVAIKAQSGRILVIKTTHFKQVSDGGTIHLYQRVDNGIQKLLTENNESEISDHQEDVLTHIIPDPIVVLPPPAVEVTIASRPLDTDHHIVPPKSTNPGQTNLIIDSETTNVLPGDKRTSSDPTDPLIPQEQEPEFQVTSSTRSATTQQPITHSTPQTSPRKMKRNTTTPKRPTLMHQPVNDQPTRERNTYEERIAKFLENRTRKPNPRYVDVGGVFEQFRSEKRATYTHSLLSENHSLQALYHAHQVTIIPLSTDDDKAQSSYHSNVTAPNISSFPADQVDPLRPFDDDNETTRVSTTGSIDFIDWSTHKQSDYYINAFQMTKLYQIHDDNSGNTTGDTKKASVEIEGEVSYRAVSTNVPKTFVAALKDPLWGPAARQEWETIMDAGTLLKIDKHTAKQMVQDGADLVVLFPVYEQKIKNGKEVFKVRLVANGRQHHPEESVYSQTPRREELLILLHLAGTHGWDLAHIDEVRAFLSAKYKGDKPVVTKHLHEDTFYQVIGALYGLKTSPKDYTTDVCDRLIKMGFTRLPNCQSIYIRQFGDDYSEVLVVFAYVDDFITTGSIQHNILEHFIIPFRALAKTTEPDWNPAILLGMEIYRDLERGTISLTMQKRIQELAQSALIDNGITITYKGLPMPPSQYLVYDEQFAQAPPSRTAFLEPTETKQYLAIVGSLIWICGVRHDIVMTTTYLSWFTSKPRKHHLLMAQHVIMYLYTTIKVPLVLGGKNLPVTPVCYTDSSLATGPKRRSISGYVLKMHPEAGAISCRSKATTGNRLNTFESELDAATNGVKELAYLRTFLEQLHQPRSERPYNLFADNMAMVNFVKGEGTATGVRYMDIRLWYVREQYDKTHTSITFMPGDIIPANLLTKLGSKQQHITFRTDVQGLKLLSPAQIQSIQLLDEDTDDAEDVTETYR